MLTYPELNTTDSISLSSLHSNSAKESAPVSEEDEAQAVRELLRLIVALSSGQLTGEMLQAKEQDAGTVSGPCRDELEHFKEVIRRIRSGNDTYLKSAKNAAADQNDQPSLQSLLESLPPELRELLGKAFPNLDDLLQEEQLLLAKQEKEGAAEVAETTADTDLADVAAQAYFWRQLETTSKEAS